MTISKFTKSVCELYDVKFCNGEHEICFVSNNDETFCEELKISFYHCSFNDLNRLSFYKFFKKYDYIVLHSLFISLKSRFLFYATGLIKKVVWIEWGYDLYLIKPIKKEKIRVRIIDKLFKNNLNAVVCIFKPDIKTFEKQYPKSKAKVFYAPYCGAYLPNDFLHYSSYSRLGETKKTNDTIYIQIGHQATPQIHHICTLRKLLKFKNEKIKLVIPLSYGDKKNAEEVAEFARKNFEDDKLMILTEFLNPDDYFKLLERIDIAIFETNRQIGLDNINRLIFRNTKLFLTKGTVMYDFFCENGVPVQNANSISDMTFHDFTECTYLKSKDKFFEFIDSLTNQDKRIDYWSKIYDELRSDS